MVNKIYFEFQTSCRKNSCSCIDFALGTWLLILTVQLRYTGVEGFWTTVYYRNCTRHLRSNVHPSMAILLEDKQTTLHCTIGLCCFHTSSPHCRYAADHRLLFQTYISPRPRRFGVHRAAPLNGFCAVVQISRSKRQCGERQASLKPALDSKMIGK